MVERVLWEHEVARSNRVAPIEESAPGGFFNRAGEEATRRPGGRSPPQSPGRLFACGLLIAWSPGRLLFSDASSQTRANPANPDTQTRANPTKPGMHTRLQTRPPTKSALAANPCKPGHPPNQLSEWLRLGLNCGVYVSHWPPIRPGRPRHRPCVDRVVVESPGLQESLVSRARDNSICTSIVHEPAQWAHEESDKCA